MLDKRLNDKGKNWRHVFKVRISDQAPWELRNNGLCPKRGDYRRIAPPISSY